MNERVMRRGPKFTHFGSIPFITEQVRSSLANLEEQITGIFNENSFYPKISPNNPNLFHLTLMMLTMPHNSTKEKAKEVMQQCSSTIKEIMMDAYFKTGEVKYFRRKDNKTGKSYVSLIYLDIVHNEGYEKLIKLTDFLIRVLLKEEIVVNNELKDMRIFYDHNKGLFMNENPHITLFRCEDLEENQVFLQNYSLVKNLYVDRMLKCNFVDLSTRFEYDGTNFYTPLARVIIEENKEKL